MGNPETHVAVLLGFSPPELARAAPVALWDGRCFRELATAIAARANAEASDGVAPDKVKGEVSTPHFSYWAASPPVFSAYKNLNFRFWRK